MTKKPLTLDLVYEVFAFYWAVHKNINIVNNNNNNNNNSNIDLVDKLNKPSLVLHLFEK